MEKVWVNNDPYIYSNGVQFFFTVKKIKIWLDIFNLIKIVTVLPLSDNLFRSKYPTPSKKVICNKNEIYNGANFLLI